MGACIEAVAMAFLLSAVQDVKKKENEDKRDFCQVCQDGRRTTHVKSTRVPCMVRTDAKEVTNPFD